MQHGWSFGGAGLACVAVSGLALLAGCASSSGPSVSSTQSLGSPADAGGRAAMILGPGAALPETPDGLLDDPSPLPADRVLTDLSAEGVFVPGLQAAQVIDTRVFSPQIVVAEIPNDESRRVKVHLPEHTRPAAEVESPDAALRGFAMGGLSGVANIDPASVADFTAIDRSGWTPPDPTVAVGPEHVVVTVNQSLAFYSRSGGLQFQQILGSQGSPGFFEPVGAGNFAFDPKCFYDHYADRFVILALEVYRGENSAYVTIAVSDDADPNGVWFKYRTDAVTLIDGRAFWWDYPGLGYDAEAIYVTSNLFPLDDGGGFGGAGFRVFDKADMLVGAPVNFTSTRDGNAASVQAAQHYGDNAADGQSAYFVRGRGGSTLGLHSIQNPLTNPVLRAFNVGVPQHSGAGESPVPGGGTLQTLGLRIQNVVWRDGSLYAAHGVADGGIPKPRWYEVDVNGWPVGGFPMLAQAGTVDPGPGVAGFFPAVAVNDAGDMGLVYGTSSSGESVGMWIAARKADDPAGMLGEPVLIRRGNGGFGPDGGQRWGDYYDATVDPVDGRTFWAIGQTQESGIGWDTRVARFALEGDPCPADLAPPTGVLDLADINAFVAGFTANDAISDLAEPFGVWDLSDINAFVAAFSAGCP